MPTTLGREILRSRLPDQYKSFADKTWDKKTSDAIATQIAQEDPDGYIDILQNLNNFAQTVVSTYGRDAALPFRDMKVSANVRNINAKLRMLIDKVLDDDKLTDAQKEEKIKELGYKYTQKVEDLVFEDADKRHTALASQINSGARGKKVQLRQMLFGDMLMKDALNRDMPYLMMDAYSDGATPTGYWVSASSGRKGYYDVQMATGQSGYLGKRVTAATHDTVISEQDCGTTDTGVPFPANSTSNIGAVLLKPFHNHPAGSIVDAKMVAEADDDEEMILRSPLTCKSKTGVCAKCNGLGENGRFPGVGEYVSLNAARSFVEPVTQGSVGCLAGDTMVRMFDGPAKKIIDIKPGDKVLGVDWYGKVTAATVTRFFSHGPKEMNRYTFQDGATLDCTPDHKVMFVDSMLAVYCGDGKKMYTYRERPVGSINKIEWGVVTIGKSLNNIMHMAAPVSESIGEQPSYDIEIDHPSHMFLLENGLVVSNSKHAGGIGGKRVINPEGDDQPTGFRSLERMFTTPSNFQGAAVLAPVDGTVTKIQPAAQGGTYITIGNKTLYCNSYRTMKVKEGDKVFAGDMLTNGVPNPMEVVALKGLGAGRVYFTKQLGKILKENGWGTERRNLESFTRAFLNKVEITNPDGYEGYLPGDTVNYSNIMADYEPRKDSTKLPVDKALNQYLEQPVLYYSVGTRITPEVASELKKYQFNDVLVNKEAPSFAARFMRPAEGLQHDKHWLPRLSGERLREGLFDATRQGITDPYDSSSYVDKIIIGPLKPN